MVLLLLPPSLLLMLALLLALLLPLPLPVVLHLPLPPPVGIMICCRQEIDEMLLLPHLKFQVTASLPACHGLLVLLPDTGGAAAAAKCISTAAAVSPAPHFALISCPPLPSSLTQYWWSKQSVGRRNVHSQEQHQ
jgi:hypothetical protein